MYFFSNTYIQINNNTKIISNVRKDIPLISLRLVSCFHLDINASSSNASGVLLLENLGWYLKVLCLRCLNKVCFYLSFKNT